MHIDMVRQYFEDDFKYFLRIFQKLFEKRKINAAIPEL